MTRKIIRDARKEASMRLPKTKFQVSEPPPSEENLSNGESLSAYRTRHGGAPNVLSRIQGV
jgi:hypothetical protein